jgi:Holliday junction DNA helicase RuvA
MISTLRGKVSEKILDQVVVEAGGLGYGLLVTADDYGQLKPGQEAKLYIYEHIRENAHDLFGFLSQTTKSLFEQLLSVNGVGPKMALNMLSVGTPEEVRAASGDTKFIQAANGVGKRVAERVVVDLKDKVGLADTTNAEALFSGTAGASKDEAAQALIALGYTVADSLNALQDVDKKLPTQARVKQALKDINS